jgi:hypothetical protein
MRSHNSVKGSRRSSRTSATNRAKDWHESWVKYRNFNCGPWSLDDSTDNDEVADLLGYGKKATQEK